MLFRSHRLTVLDVVKPGFQKSPVVVYDGGRFPFSDKSFDVSLLVTMLHHVPDPESIIREAGRVTRKSVEEGAFVNPGQALLAIVPAEVWVVANFKETELRGMKPGARVVIRVDAGSGRLAGHVDSVQSGTGARFSLLPPENATGNYVKVVQRVPVKIVLEPGDATALLRPGLSVVAAVDTRDQGAASSGAIAAEARK